jgi:uncharacterized protein YjbJ (UPF0337 family)
MNKNQVKGAGKDLTGDVQEGFGKLVRGESQQATESDRQANTKSEKLIGDTKELIRDSIRESIKRRQV